MVRMVSTTDGSSRKHSFLDSYKISDIAEVYIRDELEDRGFQPHAHGIDRRFEDLDVEQIEGKPDLRIHDSDSGKLLCYLEIKSKQNDSWLFVTNKYQWKKYVDHADDYIDPTFIVWVHLDYDTSEVYDTYFVPVRGSEQVEREFHAPDGNQTVKISDEDAQSFDEFERQIQEDNQ